MSTRSILTVVGGVVGAYFGYPQLGLTIGALVGSAVDPQQIQGPKIGEVAAQTSQEGAPRTIVYGTIACYGNVIQTGQVVKVETSESQGKGGGPEVTSERALRTYAIRICEGPIAAVLRIWADNKLVYDMRLGSGMVAESEQWIANKVVYLGDETQTPDPTLVSSVNGFTPSYRGTAYIVFISEDLTDRAGSIPQYRFEVAKTILPPSVGELTNTATDSTYFGPIYRNALDGLSRGTHTTTAVAVPGGNLFRRTYDDELNLTGSATITMQSMTGYVTPVPTFVTHYGMYDTYEVVQGDTSFDPLIVTHDGLAVGNLRPTGNPKYWWRGNGTLMTSQSRVWTTENSILIGAVAGTDNSNNPINYNTIYRWSAGVTGQDQPEAASITGICTVGGTNFYMTLDKSENLYVINNVGTFSKYTPTLGFLASQSLAFSLAGMSGFAIDEEGDVAAFVYTTGTARAEIRKVSDWSLIKTINHTFFSYPDGTRCFFSEDSLYIQTSRASPALTAVLRIEYNSLISSGPAILSEIVSDIHDRCGIESTLYDVSELTDEVEGFSLSGDYTGAAAIDSLRTVYFFDKSEHDKKLWYPKRGAAVIETLTVDDLTEVPDNTRRNQAIEVPKKLHLRYQHARSGYAPVKATAASSSPDFLTTGEVAIETAVVLDEDEAAQTADKMYKITRTEIGGPTEITVPLDVGARYVTGNNIGLSLRGQTTRLRLEQIDFAEWQLKFTLKPDRQSAYTSNLTGVPIPEPTPPPSTIVGATELAILDIPALRDSEDDLNYYVAVSGRLAPWYGARYQRSFDGGATWQTVEDITTASIMGEITADVPDASEDVTDTTNEINVVLYREGQTLESISDAEFLSEGNPFALEKADGSWEIMQFRDRVLNSDGSYTLSTLHRGRLNSGTSAHTTGARFVMLQRPSHIVAQSSYIGQSIMHRAITLGESADDTDNDFAQTYVGLSQTEWPVVDLVAVRDSSDLISAMWTPRFRFGTDDAPVNSINMIGYRVTIDDGSITSTFDLTTNQFSGFDASGMTPPMTVSVSALNRITGAGPATFDTV